MWPVLLYYMMLSLASCSGTTLTDEFDQANEEACLVGAHECKASVSFEDLQRTVSQIQSLTSISANIGNNDTTKHLTQIAENLESGKLRTGVVGIQNAGKSTFLNALLGRYFLPSSIQAQTAKEVIIIHDTSKPDGVLYGVKQNKIEQEVIVSGRENISRAIDELNWEKRVEGEERERFEKIILRAPFRFLDGMDHIKTLEISDTPGLGEAGTNTTEESKIAVKEMSAFILIFDTRSLKSESELEVLQMLKTHHPGIFEKLSRILILINAYDVAYTERNPESLQPEEIPKYVSEYLADNKTLDVGIPPENIIPFSARWALDARQWLDEPAAFLETPKARLRYEEALNLLEMANYEEIESFRQMSKENVKTVANILLAFSRIDDIERRLVNMLKRNGPAILLEAAIEDAQVEVTNMKTLIQEKIAAENVEVKRQLFSKYEQLKSKFTELKNQHISNIEQISSRVSTAVGSQISSVTDSLRQTINGGIGTKLNSHLSTFHKGENREQVFNQIRSVRAPIETLARGAMESSWNSLAASIKSSQLEHTRAAMTGLKTELVSSLQTIANSARQFPDLAAFISQISSQISGVIDSIDTNSLIPEFGGMSVEISTSSISDENLNHILTIPEQRFKNVEMSKKKKCGFLGTKRCKKRWTESQPYYVSLFSADISALQNIFSSQATSSWVQSFRLNIDQMTAVKSNEIIGVAKDKVISVLSQVSEEIQRAVDANKSTLDASEAKVKNYNENFRKVESVESELK